MKNYLVSAARMKNMPSKTMFKRFFSVLFILCFMLLAGALPASAATKTIKLKKQNFTSSQAEANKKAKTVKKGTWIVKFPSGGAGYLKFTAPKTKTYKFTLSKLTCKHHCEGHMSISGEFDGGTWTYLNQLKLKTQGGENINLFVSNIEYLLPADKTQHHLLSRYGKVKLKKNQTVYLFLFFYEAESIKLKIS